MRFEINPHLFLVLTQSTGTVVGLTLLAVTLIIIILRRPPWISIILRLLASLLAVLALSELRLEHKAPELPFSALVDISSSITESAKESFAKTLESISKEGVPLNLVPFAETSGAPAKLRPFSSAKEISTLLNSREKSVSPSGTDLSHALRSLNPNHPVFLLSDGVETTGDASSYASVASSIPQIFPLIPDLHVFQGTVPQIISLRVPLVLGAKEEGNIFVALQNPTQQSQTTTLEIWIENNKILTKTLEIPPTEELLVSTTTPKLNGGLHRVRAVISPSKSKDKYPPQEKHRWVAVQEPQSVALISGEEVDNRLLPKLLSDLGKTTKEFVAARGEPPRVNFEFTSAVIINNTPASVLPPQFLKDLESYVKHGGGLIIIGGDRSFGLGGYRGSLLDNLSPLRSIPPQTEQQRLKTAVLFLIDKSRSMEEEGRITAAKQAIIVALDQLKDGDLVAVVGFDHEGPAVALPMTEISAARGVAPRRLSYLIAAGGTNPLPAMQESRRMLSLAQVQRRHLIILSDGEFPPAGGAYLDEIRRIRDSGITVSTVALGAEADVPQMKVMANEGKGAFYHPLDTSQLPEIFIQDMYVASGEKTMREAKDFPVEKTADAQEVLLNEINSFPNLHGFVTTKLAEGAHLALTVKDSQGQKPLLASQRVDSGKVIAFASDFNARWSAPWMHWSELGMFWRNLLRSIESGEKDERTPFEIRYKVEGTKLELDLSLFDSSLLSRERDTLTATVIDPLNSSAELTFSQLRPGRFSATINPARAGDYYLQFKRGGIVAPKLAITLGGELFGEQQTGKVNLQLLNELAKASGGEINPNFAKLNSLRQEQRSNTPLQPYLLSAAFLILLIEIILRERSSR